MPVQLNVPYVHPMTLVLMSIAGAVCVRPGEFSEAEVCWFSNRVQNLSGPGTWRRSSRSAGYHKLHETPPP